MSKTIELRSGPAAIRPLPKNRARLSYLHTLPAELAAKPFDHDQLSYIGDAAGRKIVAPNALEDLTGVARAFQIEMQHPQTSRDRAHRLREMATKAASLVRDLKALTGDAEKKLISGLHKFSEQAKEDAWWDERCAHTASRERPAARANTRLALMLGVTFAKTFQAEPTASPQGPFNRFADAFLEEFAENIPPGVELQIPSGATLSKHLGALRKLNPKGFLD